LDKVEEERRLRRRIGALGLPISVGRLEKS
jgi:hypothetical protein